MSNLKQVEVICGTKVAVEPGQTDVTIVIELDSKNHNRCAGCRFELVEGIYVLQNKYEERYRDCAEDKAPTV